MDGLKDVPTGFVHEISLSQKEAIYVVNILHEFHSKAAVYPHADALAPARLRLSRRSSALCKVHMLTFAYCKPEVREVAHVVEEQEVAAKNTSLPQTVDTFRCRTDENRCHLFNLED